MDSVLGQTLTIRFLGGPWHNEHRLVKLVRRLMVKSCAHPPRAHRCHVGLGHYELQVIASGRCLETRSLEYHWQGEAES